MADKHGRTQEVHGIYSAFVNNIPDVLRPMVAKNNSEEIWFDNPVVSERVAKPGLNSGFRSETALDPNAGRSGTRRWAHFTEYAFYRHAMEIDEGVQNSVPLAPGTMIVKETTANGMAGDGAAFYNQWCAAVAGDSIYKAFFVSWFEICDYAHPVPKGFILTKEEIDLVKRCPAITNENLVWRRLKLKEYSASDDSIFTPEERFKQDFPSYPEEAFLSTGRPVFDSEKINNHIKELRDYPPVVATVKITKKYLQMFPQYLKVFKVPEVGKKYSVGADVAEGVEQGDFSSAFIMDAETREQVALFHGRLDPDLFGNILVDLAEIYNNAIITPEMNSIGFATLNAIKQRDYLRVYMRSHYDEIQDSKETSKMGWRTTSATKKQMLYKLVAFYREDEIKINDIGLLREMSQLVHESNGDVELTGKDRVVAACLSCMGLDQLYQSAVVIDPNKKEKIHFSTVDKFRELGHVKRK